MSVKVKHINDDATYLITFSLPADSNIPYEQLKEFTVLTDPWISGSWHLMHPKIVFAKPQGQRCIEHLSELEKPPNVVVVSQDKADHCHEKSLRQLQADLPGTTIYAQAGAAKRIRSWRYFPNDKVVTFSPYGVDDPEASLVRFSIPAAEELHKYPGIVPGELTMAFMAPKFDLAGVHNGIGFTYRSPMFTNPKTGSSPSQPVLVPIQTHEDVIRSRTNSTRSRANSSKIDLIGLGLKGTTPTNESFESSRPTISRRRKPENLSIGSSPYPNFSHRYSSPPDSPTRSTTTIETRTTATEYSTQEFQKQGPPTPPLAPEWLLPQAPTLSKPATLRPRAFSRSNTASSLSRLKSAISTPNLRDAVMTQKTPKKKKSLNFRTHKRTISSESPLTIVAPHTYTTDPDAPPLPNSPMSPFYPLTPTTMLPVCRPMTPFSPTSTIAGPKTISILFVPHGIPYSALEPWVTQHLIQTAALPLTLLLHPFDSVRNLWFLGGQVIQGGQHGAEIAKALMAKQWISTHDGAKEESGWLVKKVVKKVFSREEVDRILDTNGQGGWDYRKEMDRTRPRTGVDVLRVGEEIAIEA